jgi:hypothetical protein
MPKKRLTALQPTLAAPYAEFSTRLRKAILAAGVSVNGGADLEREFNLRYPFQGVTRQSAYAWLTGKARASPEKIEIISKWLGVSAHWLAYGNEDGSDSVQFRDRPPSASTSGSGKGAQPATDKRSQQLQLKFQRLPERQQELILGMMDELLLTSRIK